MKNGYCSLRAELSAQLHTDRDGVVEWANEQARLAKQFFFIRQNIQIGRAHV